MKRPTLVLLLAMLAALVWAAPAARAQDDVLRARDLRAVPPRLYDAITQLRPAWLQPAGPAATERIAVYVNGRYLGDARVLRTIETAQVTSARLRSSATVRAMDLPLPPNEFDLAIDVATRPLERPAAPGRVTLSLDAGADLRSLAHGVREPWRTRDTTVKSWRRRPGPRDSTARSSRSPWARRCTTPSGSPGACSWWRSTRSKRWAADTAASGSSR